MGPLKDSYDTVNGEYDICVLGAEGSGKSAFIMQFIYNRFFGDTDSKLEDLYTKVVRTEGSYHEITILDTNSQQDIYASSRKKQLMNNQVMMFAYSIADDSSFYAIQDLYERISEFRGSMPPIMVVALKSDLEDERKVSYEEGKSFAESINAIGFLECSAALAVNVEEAFKPLVDLILAIKNKPSVSDSKSFDVTSMQSLKEVLSSPSPTPARTESPVLSMSNQRKLDFDSIEDLEIPKFTSNSLASQPVASNSWKETGDDREQSIHLSSTASQSTVNVSTENVPSRKLTKTDEEPKVLNNQPNSKQPKSKTGCCVIT